MGPVRKANEDHFLISVISKSMRILQTSLSLDHRTRLFGDSQAVVLLVADGMGGHAAGEKASQLVIDRFVDYVLNHLTWLVDRGVNEDAEFQADLKRSLDECQKVLTHTADDTPQLRGMGTTFTLAFIVWPKVFVVHVGDSRCYLFRSGRLQQLTEDHNLAELSRKTHAKTKQASMPLSELSQNQNGGCSKGVQNLSMPVASDEDDTSELEDFSMAHVLWNVIAANRPDVHPDAFCVVLEDDDMLLMCTDGLYQEIGRLRLKEIMGSDATVSEICESLIDEALVAGASDNVTAIVARCRASEPLAPKIIEIKTESESPCQTEALSSSTPLI